jgi:hypothetical protein
MPNNLINPHLITNKKHKSLTSLLNAPSTQHNTCDKHRCHPSELRILKPKKLSMMYRKLMSEPIHSNNRPSLLLSDQICNLLLRRCLTMNIRLLLFELCLFSMLDSLLLDFMFVMIWLRVIGPVCAVLMIF